MLRMMEKVRTFLRSEEGQGLAEYALILVLISIAAILIMPDLGTAISDVFQDVIDALTGAGGGGTT